MATPDITPACLEIQISGGYTTTVDQIDADLANVKWYSVNKNGRIYVWRKSYKEAAPAKTVQMHRVILERMIGRPLDKNEIVDHKDNNPLNNTRANLRLADKSKNSQNCKKRANNTSGYKGVWFDKRGGKWVAEIRHKGRKQHLGVFVTPEDAYAVYCNAAQSLFGEFARFE